MRPARYWDDPDADLERTLDLPCPPGSRGPFDPRPREQRLLDEVAAATRFVGFLLVACGFIALLAVAGLNGARRHTTTAAVTGLITVPGALYIVASFGLAARRHWAWVTSLVVTLVVMAALVVLGIYIAALSNGPVQRLWLVAVCFVSPCLILFYMTRALPAVRDAELLKGQGFTVRPRNENAAEDQPPPRAISLDQSDVEGATSPAPAPPAPSPPPPPPRS